MPTQKHKIITELDFEDEDYYYTGNYSLNQKKQPLLNLPNHAPNGQKSPPSHLHMTVPTLSSNTAGTTVLMTAATDEPQRMNRDGIHPQGSG